MYLIHTFYFVLDNQGQIICKVEDIYVFVKFKFHLHVCFYYFKNIFFFLYSHFIRQILSLTFILKKYERVQIPNCLLNCSKAT